MAGLTYSRILTEGAELKKIVAFLLSQVPQDVELENIEVRLYTSNKESFGDAVVVDDFSYPIDFRRPTEDNPEGKVLLAYDQQVLPEDFDEKLFMG